MESEKMISLMNLYECWKAANLPPIPAEMVNWKTYPSYIFYDNVNLMCEYTIWFYIKNDKIKIHVNIDYKTKKFTIHPGRVLTRQEFIKYFSCFEIPPLIRRFYEKMTCVLPEEGNIVGVLGKGATSAVYNVKIDGVEYALKECLTYKHPNEPKYTRMAASSGISPTIFIEKECTDSTVLITEKMDGPLFKSELPVTELYHMVIEIYGILKTLEKLEINHNDFHFNNILWKKVGGSYVYKIIDFELSGNGMVNVAAYFSAFVSQLGFGSSYFDLAYNKAVEGKKLPGPQTYEISWLYIYEGFPRFLTFRQRSEILKAVDKLGMQDIFENFQEHLSFVKRDARTCTRDRSKLEKLVELGIVLFPKEILVDPELYYGNRTIQARLRTLREFGLSPEDSFYHLDFCATLCSKSGDDNTFVLVKNNPYLEMMAKPYDIGDLSCLEFKGQATIRVQLDVKHIPKVIKLIKEFWEKGYSYGSEIFLNSSEGPSLIDFTRSKPNPTTKDKATDIKLILGDRTFNEGDKEHMEKLGIPDSVIEAILYE